jgi:hypothetical protein
MAQYLAIEATRQDSQKWPQDPIGCVVKDNSPAPQQPDVSCDCCVLTGLEALCACNALDGAGRFRSMPFYARSTSPSGSAASSASSETHSAAATNKSLAAAARAERQIRIDLSED